MSSPASRTLLQRVRWAFLATFSHTFAGSGAALAGDGNQAIAKVAAARAAPILRLQ
jgi:hypothetical protein